MPRIRVSVAALLLAFVPSLAWSQPLNVKSYGATGNGSTDDTSAFNAALAAAPASGAEIYVPAGTYKLTGTLNVVNKSIAFRGEGQRISNLRWDAGTDGLSFQSTTTTNTSLTIKSLSFLRGVSSTGIAINATWAATTGWHGANGLVTASIEDVNIAASPYGTGLGWASGIVLGNATNAKIRNFTIMGADFNVGHSGIMFTGKSIANYVSDGDISHFPYGISTWDEGDGFHITDVEIIAVISGIKLVAASRGRGTSIQGCHVNSLAEGIMTWGFGDVAITNNLIYRWGTETWRGISATHAESTRITGNYIVKLFSGGSTAGIVLEGNAVRNIVQGNITEGMGTGIWLMDPTVADNIVSNNLNRSATTPITNSGTGNHLFNNP